MEKDKTFSYELGLELVGAYNFESNFYVRQAYVDFLGLSVGSKIRNGELKNQELSSGALTFSGNSLPIPQVRIEYLIMLLSRVLKSGSLSKDILLMAFLRMDVGRKILPVANIIM